MDQVIFMFIHSVIVSTNVGSCRTYDYFEIPSGHPGAFSYCEGDSHITETAGLDFDIEGCIVELDGALVFAPARQVPILFPKNKENNQWAFDEFEFLVEGALPPLELLGARYSELVHIVGRHARISSSIDIFYDYEKGLVSYKVEYLGGMVVYKMSASEVGIRYEDVASFAGPDAGGFDFCDQ